MIRHPLTGPWPASRARRAVAATIGVATVLVTISCLAAASLLAAPATEVIDAQRAHIRDLEAEIGRIDARAGAAADAHAAAVRRQDELRRQIDQTRQALAETRAARAEAQDDLAARLVAIYTDRQPSLVEVLLSTGSISEAADTQMALQTIGTSDARLVDHLRSTQERLDRLRAGLERDRAEVDATVASSQARMQELNGLIVDRGRVLSRARGQLDTLVAQDRRDRESRAARARRDAAAAAAGRRAAQDLRRRAVTGAPAPATTPSAPAPSSPAPADPAPAAAPAGGDVSAALQRIAECESGGNPRAVSPSGQYRGKYQFDIGTWQANGGTGDPAAAPEAEQDRVAAALYARSGPAPWPVCGYR